jgi:hypothetical protein
MDDIYLEIILKSDPNEINKMCSSNKKYNLICKQYKQHISKIQLKRYNVLYKDPNNFVYIMNKVSYDPSRSFHEI